MKPFLVIARIGDNSIHHNWICDSRSRNWDLLISAYGSDLSNLPAGDLPTVVDRGTKWDSIVRLFASNGELFNRYEYFLFPDDDVFLTSTDIDRIFELTSEYNLYISQPALHIDSYISYPFLLNCPGFKMRFVNFVESMAPCIRADYFKQILPLFEKHYTGWGTDLVWCLLMDSPAYRAAIIDDVVMTHTRPLYSGPLYSFFHRHGIDPSKEIKAVTNYFVNNPKNMIVYAAINEQGKNVNAFNAKLLSGLNLICIAAKTRLPYHTFRMGMAMLIRIFTRSKYMPEKLVSKPGNGVHSWYHS